MILDDCENHARKFEYVNISLFKTNIRITIKHHGSNEFMYESCNEVTQERKEISRDEAVLLLVAEETA